MKTLTLVFALAFALSSLASSNVSNLNYFTGESKMFFNAGFGYNDLQSDATSFGGTLEARYGVLANSFFGVDATYTSFDTGIANQDRTNDFGNLNINWATRFVDSQAVKWDWLTTYSPRMGDSKLGIRRGTHQFKTGFAYTNMLNEMIEFRADTNFALDTRDDSNNNEITHDWDFGVAMRTHVTPVFFFGLGASAGIPTSGEATYDTVFNGNATLGYAIATNSNITGSFGYGAFTGVPSAVNHEQFTYGINYNIEL